MNFPENIEEKLGFDHIRTAIKNLCDSESGALLVDNIKFTTNAGLIEKLCTQTEEFVKILTSSDHFVSVSCVDAIQYVDKIKVEGTYLEPEILNEIRIFVESHLESIAFFRTNKEKYPLLFEVSAHSNIDKSLATDIYSKIDDKGTIRNNATPELQRIRREIINLENKARNLINKIIKDTRQQGFSPQDSSLTIRNGRLVIPVKAEYKRQIKGFIHDESSSGQTVYMEPAEALETNNDLKDLQYREKREIQKVLADLSDKVRMNREPLLTAHKCSSVLDLVKAKAKYARQTECILPELSTKKTLDWKNARHPVLETSLARQNKKIVSQNIYIDEQQRILVISGPNAGGKSVCLTTIGLLQYMLQCGLLIPVAEGSKASVFKSIFLDIGDEQSIENDLSTYSSHLTNMAHFVKRTNKNTLLLIDEFGTGTEPQFGGAIAEALLESFIQAGSYGAITTHYANLKKLANDTDGLQNARMKFDVNRLEPLFQLEIGKPGSSFAFEIASKIGLPKNVLHNARIKVGVDQVQMDKLLNELEKDRKALDEKLKAAEEKEKTLDITLKNYADLKEDLTTRKKQILNKAKEEARQLVSKANQKIESAVHEIKTSKADTNVANKHRYEIKSFEKGLQPEEIKRKEENIQVLNGPVNRGDMVRIKGQESVGEVASIGKKDAEVVFGAIKSKVKLNRLEKIKQKKASKSNESTPPTKFNYNISQAKSNFSTELDIRGYRAEEAHKALQEFIDDAILFSAPSLRILHGKGDGILKTLVRKELTNMKGINKIESEHPDRGGEGITIVYME